MNHLEFIPHKLESISSITVFVISFIVMNDIFYSANMGFNIRQNRENIINHVCIKKLRF